jgi:hypothetical protein
VLRSLRNRLAARHLLWKSRRPYVVALDDAPLVVFPGVLDPVATKVGAWLAGVMATTVRPGEDWVDMGCGTGVVGLSMARAGARVRCVDIDPTCVRNAAANAVLQRSDATAVESDLFANIPEAPHGVVYNVPFWPGEPAGKAFGRAMYAGAEFEAIHRYRARADAIGVSRVLVALSEAGLRHAEARAAFGPHALLRRDRLQGEWLVLLEAR